VILAYAIGSPAAVVAAATGIVAVSLFLLKGVPLAFGIQNSTINTLERKVAELTSELKTAKGEIATLQGIITQTRDLSPVIAVVTALGERLASHEDRAAERHTVSMDARKSETDSILNVLQLIADRMPPEPNGR
jgi:hypothetical protein